MQQATLRQSAGRTDQSHIVCMTDPAGMHQQKGMQDASLKWDGCVGPKYFQPPWRLDLSSSDPQGVPKNTQPSTPPFFGEPTSALRTLGFRLFVFVHGSLHSVGPDGSSVRAARKHPAEVSLLPDLATKAKRTVQTNLGHKGAMNETRKMHGALITPS